MSTKSPSSFVGVLIRENPFWFRGFVLEFTEPERTTVISEFDPPIPLQSLPEKIKRLPKGVRFTPSPETLESCMVYSKSSNLSQFRKTLRLTSYDRIDSKT